MGKTRTITRNRSSKTGRFVPDSYAKRHPATTERERLKVPVKKNK
jgi:hypothetical protein